MYKNDRPLEMTSFSVKDILNLPENSIDISRSESTLASTQCSEGNSRSSSCGPIVCNQQAQESSYTSKDKIDFVSLIGKPYSFWSARLQAGKITMLESTNLN